ncbi:hypothetical protein WJX72_010347 [[Myrmecia] bisecta]|uniref:Methyltransferase type 11 domain-containing protein n=1 Tax=[Myrmecia] bisecta TaxID=41462 RepID=A0AAW1QT44_9CHLO
MGSSSTFHQLFQAQSSLYSLFRPDYPSSLYQTVLRFADLQERQLALDVATGTGQVATELAKWFERVLAIDPSAEQLKEAVQMPNIEYREAAAEATTAADHSVDLLTVGQALHWFDLPAFYREARRVLQPGGTLAAWGYGNNLFPGYPKAQALTEHLYEGILGPYWSDRRKLVEQHYAGCEPGPEHFAVVERAEVPMAKTMSVAAYVGYLSSWSAYNTYRQKHPDRPDPLVQYKVDLLGACGMTEDQQQLEVVWPIFILMAKQPAALDS